ncbi:hypothetical protein EJB05_17249, partial [Eragrostis curvula]
MAALLVAVLTLALAAGSATSSSPSPDAAALLAFKSVCSDPAAALGSWTESTDPCAGGWRGVTCHRSPPRRVRRVVLEGLRLRGHAAALELLAGLPFLSFLSLKNNTFAGSLHGVDLSRLAPHLKLLHLSGNGFSGRFPESVLRLRHLRRLDLSGNRLTGAIPPEIGHRLRALLTLNLARNQFVGTVPTSLDAVAELAELDVSGNRLVGWIPKRLAAAFPASSFAGNPGLCGAPLPRRCNEQQQTIVYNKGGGGSSDDGSWTGKRKKRDRWMVVLIMSAVGAAVASLILAALCTALWLKKRKPKPTRQPRTTSSPTRSAVAAPEETVRFDGCCVEFDVSTLMQGAAEMLGKGAAATTYRVVMGGNDDVDEAVAGVEEAKGEVVVVKRMRRREGASRGDERRRRELVRQMGTWRHPNVVGLRAFFASSEELLLVFDYVPNGSLHSLLHENRGPARVPLDWQTRLKLAQDAAHGLAYLHGVSGGTLSHRHLTSSNILVDGDGNARVSDFALLQLLAPAPPTAALQQQQQDVHGFGVILLELLTGRPDADQLPRWARAVARAAEWTPDAFDVELPRSKAAEDEMVALLQVALLCVADDPRERPRMAVVAKMIEDIRDRGSKRSNKCSATASPSQAARSYESSPCVSEDTTRSTPASSS